MKSKDVQSNVAAFRLRRIVRQRFGLDLLECGHLRVSSRRRPRRRRCRDCAALDPMVVIATYRLQQLRLGGP